MYVGLNGLSNEDFLQLTPENFILKALPRPANCKDIRNTNDKRNADSQPLWTNKGCSTS